jgi:RNA polymerase subunit RPABC4/transcription elongation factor Spt4
VSSYHEICPKCEDETITHGWSPSTCPFCKINQLERELAEARMTIDDVCRVIAKEHEGPRLAAMRIVDELAEVRNQRDTLADAANKYTIEHAKRGAVSTKTIEQLEQAIAVVKGGDK